MRVGKMTIKAPLRALQKNVGQTLRLTLTKRARTALRKALGSRRSMTVQITVKARDGSANEATVRRKITLRR
jgi:hypothetical protein